MRSILAAIVVGLTAAAAHAQYVPSDDELSNPIEPAVSLYRYRLGGVVGVGPAFQSGGLKTTECECPPFTDGAGHSLAAGIVGEYYFTQAIDIGVLMLYDYRTIDARYREYEAVPLTHSATGETIVQRAQFRHIAAASVTSLGFHPFVKFHPYKGIFLRTGLGINFAMASSLRHEKELLDRAARLPNGEEAELSLNRSDPRVFSSTQALIQDSDLPGLKSPMLFWDIAAGIDIRAGRKMIVTPVFQYSFPLSDASSSGSAFRMSGWMIMAEVKVKFR